jgi:hypothetical protein
VRVTKHEGILKRTRYFRNWLRLGQGKRNEFKLEKRKSKGKRKEEKVGTWCFKVRIFSWVISRKHSWEYNGNK